MSADTYRISSSPHFHRKQTTSHVMFLVAMTLLPAAIWGSIVFGWGGVSVLLVSVISTLFFELLITKGKTLSDGSALVTGLLLGMNFSPLTPIYIPVVASAFAICVVKFSFGGLGANWMNPALAGRSFVFFCFTKQMTRWQMPASPGVLFSSGGDVTTGATPLTALKGALSSGISDAASPLEIIGGHYAYTDLLLGRTGGCIGEVSALLLLIGGITLLCFGVITWEIPVAYLGSFSALILIFGGMPLGTGLMSGDILFHLLTGGVILGAFFMATDMVTSPITSKGMIIFGLGCGIITFLIRIYGNYPEGVMLSILFMNILTPLIDRLCKPRHFGAVKSGGNA